MCLKKYRRNKLKNKLLNNIDTLVKSTPIDNRFSLERAISGYLWKATAEAINSLELLSKITEYQIFNNHLQYLGNSGSNITLEQLLNWLIERARIVGAKQAIQELDNYVSASEIEVDLIQLVVGVLAECEWTFTNGVKFTSPHNLCDTNLARDLVSEHYEYTTPYPKVTSVFIENYRHPKIHRKNTDVSNDEFKSINIPFDEINITTLCLSLARHPNYGIHSVATTTIAHDSMPIVKGGRSWGVTPFKHPPLGPAILEIEFRNADEILKKYNALDSVFKTKLLIPLKKLNDYGSGENLVERAIDLRTCLESMFLDDNIKEQISFRLALRASIFLGSSLEERKEIFSIMKKAYSACSSAVHNGDFKKKDKPDNLKTVAIYAKQALTKLITGGPVNWADLEIKN